MNAPVIHNLVQGSDEWRRYRAEHLNASDAPAVMGASKYRSRQSLLAERATGIPPEISEGTQRAFDRGHEVEEKVRAQVEKMIGEELFPATMSIGIDGLPLSASLDGVTLDGSTIFECKLWNEELAERVRIGNLEPHYYWQLEQQLLVSGASRAIFATGDGGDKLETMEYVSQKVRWAHLLEGWHQFQRDLAEYSHADTPSKPVGAPVAGFGALTLHVEGHVIASNMDAFKASADAFIARLPKPADLVTDQDFSDAESAVKACAEAESRIKSAKDAGLAQMADVDAVFRAADTIAETIRAARLALSKSVAAEKERRRADIVQHYVAQVREHYDAINRTLGEHRLSPPQSLVFDIGNAIKGLKTLSSITDACDAAAARLKIEASQRADRVRECMLVLDEFTDHKHLFADRLTLCAEMRPEDLRNMARVRVADEAKRAGAQKAAETFAAIVEPGPTDDDAPMLKLGDICARIAPLSISATGLAELGFEPVGHAKNAKLYSSRDLPRMRAAMVAKLEGLR